MKKTNSTRTFSHIVTLCLLFVTLIACAQRSPAKPPKPGQDAKSTEICVPPPKVSGDWKADELDYKKYGIFQSESPLAETTQPIATTLPLVFEKDDCIAFVGNTLLERSGLFGHLETLLQQRYPQHHLVFRNLAWPADAVDVKPRPDNFATELQHLTRVKADVIFAAYGFNESFAGVERADGFEVRLAEYIRELKKYAFNGKSCPKIVLFSPIANENFKNIPAGDLNNQRLAAYIAVMRKVAAEQQVGFVDVFEDTKQAFASSSTPLTINGVHLNEAGYATFAKSAYRGVTGESAPDVNDDIRQVVIDKNRQFLRRFRPVNTFYYVGGRSQTYGYLDFLPAMRNFDMLVANRDQRVWDLSANKVEPKSAGKIDDSNIPPLPQSKLSRGANRWMTAADELKEFDIDPRFEVNLFAGEEQFPDVAAPIQMRWDSRGRLWVSCSTTYPHVYPGDEPGDKLVILEDTDGDGRADTSKVFADDLHIPLSFEFGDGGVYVSEQPNLTFLKDTDGDDKADVHEVVLAGFGSEDSHHSLHDFAWSPEGDLMFRESIFHHSQVETPYGPVRQQNSGWFRYQPRDGRLTSFGTYPSTNPWGVTFDDWGNHVASHPLFAEAHHALDPPYPQQHERPNGMTAYSGVCGHEFVDFDSFPDEMQGQMIKVRYKPTNRVEIHEWNEGEFGYDEKMVGQVIFSRNLSFIPVDLRFGPRGAMYVCDWYNPVKGHAQYSLRDDRRDRHSGRIWRITAKGKSLQDPPPIADTSVEQLLDNMKRKEYRYRYWSKRELRAMPVDVVKPALDQWVAKLDTSDPRHRHHQLEAIWVYHNMGKTNPDLLRELLACDEHHARAAAVKQVRYWHREMDDAEQLLTKAAADSKGLVRMQAVTAASYLGTEDAYQAIKVAANQPHQAHLKYAIECALNAKTMRPFWKDDADIKKLMRLSRKAATLKQARGNKDDKTFDRQKNVKSVTISCVPERMLYDVKQFVALTDQPVKLTFKNPDATDHNLLIVKKGALEEVGIAANDMARDPRNANSDFIPQEKRSLILHNSPLIGPTKKYQAHVMRFNAPKEPGIYPYVCSFPGHWIVMKGNMVVVDKLDDVEALLATQQSTIVKEWTMDDFADLQADDIPHDENSIQKGMQSFMKAQCLQCHVVKGHGVKLGPELTKINERFKGKKLLQQMLEPSSEINKDYRNFQFILESGKSVSGVVVAEDKLSYRVAANLLNPDATTTVVKSEIDEQEESKISAMPVGLLNTLTREEILCLLGYLEVGGYELPGHGK